MAALNQIIFLLITKERKRRKEEQEGRKGTSRRKASRDDKALLPYETLQFCFEGEAARDGLQCCTSSGPMKAGEM